MVAREKAQRKPNHGGNNQTHVRKKHELAPYKKTSKEILGPTSKECKDSLTVNLNN